MKYHEFKPTRRSPQKTFSYQSYRPSPQVVRVRPRLRRRYGKIVIGIIGILGLANILFIVMYIHMNVLASQRAASSSIQNTALASNITSILTQNSQYQIGVALTDIEDGQTKSFGNVNPYEAASTAKVLTACAYYHLAETGRVTLDAPMGSFNAAFQIKQMVNDSDNDSWALLVAAITDKGLQTYANSIGVRYDETGNTISPVAMAQLLAKLYEGKLLNQVDTAQLLSYMQDTNDEDLIPAALPAGVTVYHKYGLLGNDLHDASIVVYNGHAYGLVIYTKDSSGYSDNDPRIAIIHNLTQTITRSLLPTATS